MHKGEFFMQKDNASNRIGVVQSSRSQITVANTSIDSVMLQNGQYHQIVADSYHDIDKKSNQLFADGYKVISITPVISGRFVVLGVKNK